MTHTLVKGPEIPSLLERWEKAPGLGLDTESSGPNLVGKKMLNVFRSSLTGVSISTEEGSWYIPVGHRKHNVNLHWLSKFFGWTYFGDTWIHNVKHELHAANTAPLPWVLGETWPNLLCTQNLAHLAQMGYDQGRKSVSFGLKKLAKLHLGMDMLEFEEATKGVSFCELSPKDKTTLRYACEDAEAALRLSGVLRDGLLPGQEELFRSVRGRTPRCFAEMEATGFGLDVDRLEKNTSMFEKRVAELEEEWAFEVGPVNIRSSQQLQKLYDDGDWSTVGVKENTQGFSTEKEYVEKQMVLCEKGSKGWEAARIKVEHSRLSKLVSTYGHTLVEQSRQYPDFRLHGSFNPTGTVTGRPSSSGPNLLNIPARSAEGKLIRESFTAGMDDWTLVSADYSQIELRILAHLMGEGNLYEGFHHGDDPHQLTANLAGTDRDGGKYLNFAIIYGVGMENISKNLQCSISKAKKIMDTLNRNEPGIARLRNKIIAKSQSRGYVKTLAGRHQLLPDLKASGSGRRGSAERKCFNTPHQGGAADIMDAGMMAFYRAKDHDRCKLVCQVYDDLVTVMRNDYVEEGMSLLQSSLENAWDLKVPLVAEPAHGYRWSEHK